MNKMAKLYIFAQFKEGDLVEDERNAEVDESISSSIDELSTEDHSDDGSISTNAAEDIQDESQIHPDINTSDAIFKIRDRI